MNFPLSAGRLIAFEGLDQSGKQTQAERLRDGLKLDGRKAPSATVKNIREAAAKLGAK